MAFLRRPEPQPLPRSGVELVGDRVQIGLRDVRHARALRQVPADEPVRVLVRAPLPGVVRGGEVELHRDESPVRVDVIVMGLDRYGGRIAKRLTQRGLRVLGVDFDPQALQTSRRIGLTTQYGDVADPEFALSLPLSSARMVVSTLPQLDVNEAIAHGLEVAGFDGSFIATAHDDGDAARLRLRDGMTDTLVPFSDAADQAADIMEAALDVEPEAAASVTT